MQMIIALRRLRQEDYYYETRVGYIGSSGNLWYSTPFYLNYFLLLIWHFRLLIHVFIIKYILDEFVCSSWPSKEVKTQEGVSSVCFLWHYISFMEKILGTKQKTKSKDSLLWAFCSEGPASSQEKCKVTINTTDGNDWGWVIITYQALYENSYVLFQFNLNAKADNVVTYTFHMRHWILRRQIIFIWTDG